MSTRKPKILLIDDDEISTASLATRLGKKGFDCKTCGLGKAGLDIITNEPDLDLILLDIGLPDISGLEVLKTIRTKKASIELPVMMLTIQEDADSTIKAFSLGANDYLTKPTHIDVAKARIDTHIKLKNLHRESLAKQELETLNIMIATYNHEINNPLMVAISNLGSAQKKGEEKYFGKAEAALHRIGDIVKKIANLTENGLEKEEYTYGSKKAKLG